MKRSKLNPGFIAWVKPLIENPDESVTITRAEYADIHTTIVREVRDEARKVHADDVVATIVTLIGMDMFNRLERFLFDDDEPNAADKTDVSDGKE